MTRALACAGALALGIGVAGTLTAGCNLLVGDYSIRDGLVVVAEDAALPDIEIVDHRPRDRRLSEQEHAGKAAGDTADGGDDDRQR